PSSTWAIVEGRITTNPVEPTRAPEIKVAREPLQLETYNATRTAAEYLPVWFPLAMDLALVTGQRREDIVNMKFSDIVDGRLHVTQIKTGMTCERVYDSVRESNNYRRH
ncbi:hypothetical protein GFK02_23280, partial [Salmonella enterica subsp. enterica serovar Enteritidis]|nr:hypothetical protein [Salmonella enterica subsp. enterica serovar Enteritidis]